MADFWLCVLQYVLIMIVLMAIGFAGARVGISLRKSKDKKAALAEETAGAENSEE